MKRPPDNSSAFELKRRPASFINIRIFRYVDPDAAIVDVSCQECTQK
jgi:hypothetical protein